MKAFMISIVLMMLAASIQTAEATRRCKDPKRAVLKLLKCINANNSTCAAASYLPSFKQFHNEKLVTVFQVTEVEVWDFVFFTVPRFEFDIKFVATVGTNRVDLRYVETITSTDGTNAGLPGAPLTTYPFNQTFVQHEHVLIQMDNDCKIFKWNQYGDNEEQAVVETLVDALVAALLPPPN